MPPLLAKSIDTTRRLTLLWNLALRELAKATRIVIIGLSFTPSDTELRWLIRQSNALRKESVELDIVNPEPEHQEAARALFGAVARARTYASLDDFLAKTA